MVLRRTLVVRLIWDHRLLLRTHVRFLVISKVSESIQYASICIVYSLLVNIVGRKQA